MRFALQCRFWSGLFIMVIMAGLNNSVRAVPADPLKAAAFDKVRVTDEFWRSRLATNAAVTIPHVLDRTKESLVDLDRCGRIYRGDHSQLPSNRLAGISDLFKAMEAAACTLALCRDENLLKRLDEAIATVSFGQRADGYLYGLVHEFLPEGNQGSAGKTRYANDVMSHELYNVGHLYEGAVAHYRATGKTNWLAVAEKNARHVNKVFFEGDPDYNGGKPVLLAPGHQEIELALCRLYEATGNGLYLQMAKKFVDLRGVNAKFGPFFPEYAQQHKPVREQREAVGHAVRFGYFWASVADVARLTGDDSYRPALDGVWDDLVNRKLYITGGLGGGGPGESFAGPYELPNRTAYSETCAAIANVFFNFRMYLLTGEAKYLDVAEVSLLNTSLAGVNLEGNKFNYVNPLEADGRPNAKGVGGRLPWYGTACCIVNIARLLPQVPGYLYTYNQNAVNVTLYGSSETEIPLASGKVKIVQTSDYPFDGKVTLRIAPEKEAAFTLRLRIPTWASAERFMPSALYSYVDQIHPRWTVTLNGKAVEPKMDKGFAVIDRQWTAGDQVTLELPMPARLNAAIAKVEADRGSLAVTRGPLVYAAEAVDNEGAPQRFVVDKLHPDFQVRRIQDGVLNGMIEVSAAAKDVEKSNLTARVRMIPYFAWNNRGDFQPMVIWLTDNVRQAQRAMALLHLVSSKKYGRVTASHTGPNDFLGAITDGQEPANSGDNQLPRWTSLPQRNKKQTITFEFDQPRKVSQFQVYWVDNGKDVRVPASWSLERKVNGRWEDYGKYITDEYEVAKDRYNAVMPNEVKMCDGIRLQIQPQNGSSVGIYEVKIDE